MVGEEAEGGHELELSSWLRTCEELMDVMSIKHSSSADESNSNTGSSDDDVNSSTTTSFGNIEVDVDVDVVVVVVAVIVVAVELKEEKLLLSTLPRSTNSGK